MIFLASNIIVSYLLGSIPTAYLLGKWIKGIDIRKLGSGNVGATNAFREIGRPAGVLVLLVDMAKGFLSVSVVSDYFLQFYSPVNELTFRSLAALAAVCGHLWSVFLLFYGGKGIATGLGVIAGMGMSVEGMWLVFWLCLGIWILAVFIWKYVSLGSLLAFFSLPILLLILNKSIELVFLGIILCLLVTWRHKTNISRLIRGEETKIFTGKSH